MTSAKVTWCVFLRMGPIQLDYGFFDVTTRLLMRQLSLLEAAEYRLEAVYYPHVSASDPPQLSRHDLDRGRTTGGKNYKSLAFLTCLSAATI